MISYNCNNRAVIKFTTYKGDYMEYVNNKNELNTYEKKKIAIKYWLKGKSEHDSDYYHVLKNLDIVMKNHEGFNDGNVSPDFTRQIEIMKTKKVSSKNNIDMDVVEFDNELNNYEKKKLAIKYWLIGKAEEDSCFYDCVKAMELAVRYHTGVRKDNVTPEFQHQIEIISNIRTSVKDLMFPAETLTVAFLHDLVEDYGIGAKYWNTQKERLGSLKPVTLDFITKHFGKTVSDSVDRISKMADGETKSKNAYFRGISECPIASVAKLEDRCNNMDSMLNVFTLEKQINYAREVSEHFLPMLKKATKNFPEQEAIYMRFKNVLTSQVKSVQNMATIFEMQGLDLKQVPIVSATEQKRKRLTA